MFEFIIEPFMSLGSMVMQTTTGSPELDSVISIVISVGIIAGVVGKFLMLRSDTHKYGQMLDTFSQKTVENEEMMKRIGKAVVETIPEVKEPLKKYGAEIEYMEKRTTVGADQLTTLRDIVLPKDSQRATAANIQREDKAVF
jgi:hypothetical protein